MEACCRAAASRVPSSLKEAEPGAGGGARCVRRPSSAVSAAAALAHCAARSPAGSGAGATASAAAAAQSCTEIRLPPCNPKH